jgi:hypothetical protein
MNYRINADGIDRDMTDEEVVAYEKQCKKSTELDAQLKDQADARIAVYKKLGLTDAEIAQF